MSTTLNLILEMNAPFSLQIYGGYLDYKSTPLPFHLSILLYYALKHISISQPLPKLYKFKLDILVSWLYLYFLSIQVVK